MSPHESHRPRNPTLTTYNGKIPWCLLEVKLNHIAIKMSGMMLPNLPSKWKLLMIRHSYPLLLFMKMYVFSIDLFTIGAVSVLAPKSQLIWFESNWMFFNNILMRTWRIFLNIISNLSLGSWDNALEGIEKTFAMGAFLHWEVDKEAVLSVMDKNPSTLDEAIDLIKRANH